MSAHVKPIRRFLNKRDNIPNFDAVVDPRHRRGRRWSAPSLLTTVFIAMVAMEKNLRGAESLTERFGGWGKRFGIKRRVPDSTLAAFLSRLTDEDGLRDCLVRQIRDAERRRALEPVKLPLNVTAIDGKTIWCGQDATEDPACQNLSKDNTPSYRHHALHAVLVSAASEPCIDQMLVPAKTNEMGAFEVFFRRLVNTYGRSRRLEVLTLDAGFTSAHNADLINDAGIGYVMGVKGNQPTLLAEAHRLCGSGAHKHNGHVCEAATDWERYRGKRIRRELFRSREIEGWPDWRSARQAWRVKQTTRHDDGRVEVFNRYFITNLAWGKLNGHQILAVVRAHWGVENGCHWTLDVPMREDRRPWCKQGKALRMLSWLRLMAYNALRFIRDRHLRSHTSRTLTWDNFKRDIAQAICTPSAWGCEQSIEASAVRL